ncbi:MAG: ATP-binding protein, partial [Pseudomonadota bacterium]
FILNKKNKDHTFIVNIERFPIVSRGNIALIIVMHNITESKQNEKMFADFVANASHEIRTPLTSLIGFIDTLQNAAKDDPKSREKFLAIMKDQADRMSCLIKELLSLSDIEKNINNEPTTLISLYKVIKAVNNQLNWKIEEKNMNLIIDLEDNLPLIMGDYSQLVQVFTNLILNAIKYSERDTNIIITSELLKRIPDDVMIFNCEEVLAINVIDQGKGIAAEHIDRLTERFYRVDNARSAKIGGYGLGLSIVKNIMLRHKGFLKITSELGKGSCFTVYFPIRN